MKNRAITKKYKSLNLGEVALPVCIERSQDNELVDIEGNVYIDFTSGYGVTNVGWQRKELIDAAKAQLDKLTYSPPWFPTEETLALSELLHAITNHQFDKCVRATGGAEANEIIFKASYCMNEKPGVLSFYRSYHGGSRFAVNLSDNETFHFPSVPHPATYHKIHPPYCYRCPLGKDPETCGLACADMIEQTIIENPDIGIFYLEPVIGSGGVILLPKEYLEKARQICKKHKVTFVFDEVITGFGRLGALTAMELFDIVPDAVAFAKGMGGGVIPIGAAMLSEPLAKALGEYEDVSPTFAWTPIACAVAKTSIELTIREDLSGQAAAKGDYLLQKLRILFEQYLPEYTGEIRGRGLLIGIELVNNQEERKPHVRLAQRLSLGLVRSGLMICESWDFHIMLLCPPLNISQDHLDKAIAIFEKELQGLAKRL